MKDHFEHFLTKFLVQMRSSQINNDNKSESENNIFYIIIMNFVFFNIFFFQSVKLVSVLYSSYTTIEKNNNNNKKIGINTIFKLVAETLNTLLFQKVCKKNCVFYIVIWSL